MTTATTVTLATATHTGDLTFVGFATWLDESVMAGGHIELWRDSVGRLFAWSVDASGQSVVRLVP